MLASTASSPFLQLCSHVDARRTGEFVASAANCEVHVFLLNGRVAWATDTRQPLEFIRFLTEERGVDPSTLREVVETCLRERRPLGDTLIEWNIASFDDVRDALEAQFRHSLDALRQEPDGSSVFLDRPHFQGYDERLTIDIAALFEEESAPAAEGNASQDAIEREITRAARNAIWVAVENGRTQRDARVPAALREILQEGNEFVVRRAPGGGEVGFVASNGSHVYLGYQDDEYGLLLLSLSSFIPVKTRPPVVQFPRYEPIENAARVDASCTAAVERLREALDFGPSLYAVALLDQDRLPLFSLDRSRDPGEWLRRIAERPALAKALETTGTRLAVADGACWLFGVALEDAGARSAWVLLDRHASQSLGWAALSSTLGSTKKKRFGKKKL